MKWTISKKITSKEKKEYANYNDILIQLLINRGISDINEAERFLSPCYEDLNDPYLMYDSLKAAERIETAISEKQKIFIHGDYDVDGMTATAILWNYLYKQRKADVTPYIPSRVDEGYGLSESSVKKLKEKGAELIITVDCGIRDLELVEKENVDFIIVDHHQPGEINPGKAIIVHPMYPGKEYQFENLSGCAVTWKLISTIEKKRNTKNFNQKIIEGIDLVAMSTITDLMPLKGENRTLVYIGLQKIKQNPTFGLNSLIKASNISKDSIDTYHLGFIIGPALNAAGRIGDPMDGVRLLSTKSHKLASVLSEHLIKLNSKRQEMTNSVMEDINKYAEKNKDDSLFFAENDNWSEGIIGLAAGKFLEEVYRPVIVVTGKGDIVRGSARSIIEFDITEAIENFSDLLEKYGGHSQAAGFTIKRKNLDKFRKEIVNYASKKLKGINLEKELNIDMEIKPSNINWDLIEIVEKLRPYGVGNRRPLFQVNNVVVVTTQGIGDNKHLRLTIKDEKSDFIQCIFFNAGDWVKKLKPGTIIDIVGVPELNVWNGEEKLQFNVSDLRISN